MPRSFALSACTVPGLRRYRWPALACASLVCIRALAADTDSELQRVLDTLARVKHGHVLFQEQIESPKLKRPLRTSGELFFDAPDRLEKRTLSPTPDDLVLEGDIVTMVRGAQRRSFPLSQYPQLRPLLTGIRATLEGDAETLESNFRLALDHSAEKWTLTLRPPENETSPTFESVVIRGSAGRISEVIVERFRGERSRMTFTEPDTS